MLEISVASSVKTAKAFDFSIFLARFHFSTSESSITTFLTKGDHVLKSFMSSSPKESSSNNRELNFKEQFLLLTANISQRRYFHTQH